MYERIRLIAATRYFLRAPSLVLEKLVWWLGYRQEWSPHDAKDDVLALQFLVGKLLDHAGFKAHLQDFATRLTED